MKTKLSCDASVKFQELKMWKWRFRARLLSNFKSARYENEAFVRGFRPIWRIEDVKTKLSCDASFKFQELKMWAHVFDAAVPMHKVSQHMQNTIAQHHQGKKSHLEPSVPLRSHFEVDPPLKWSLPQPPRTRAYYLSPQRKLRLPEQNTSFRANPNIQMISMMYKNEAFVRCIRQIRKVEDMTTKLLCEASVKFLRIEDVETKLS